MADADAAPDGSAGATSAAQRPICAICYEDLRPVAELLHLQQWLEYCPAGKGPTCPMCKQSCGTRHKPTRLYFQSTTDGELSQPSSFVRPGLSSDTEKLTEQVDRLEKKNLALTEIVDSMKAHTKKLTEEIQAYHELVKSEMIRMEDLQREKQHIQQK